MVDLLGTKRRARTLTAALSVLGCATLLGFAVVVGLVTGTPSASAQASKRPSVLLMIPESAPASPMQALQEVLFARLRELGVQVQLSASPHGPPAVGEQSPEPPDVLAFIWLETQPDLIVVHFYEAAGTNLRERRIPVVNLDAASIEEVAVVVRSAVSALLERSERTAEQGTTEQMTAQQAESSPPARVSPGAEPSPVLATRDLDAPDLEAPDPEAPDKPLRLSLSYVAQDYAPDTSWNQGATVGVAWQWGTDGWADGWSVGASYAWFPVLEHQTDVVGLTLARHPVEVSLAWSLPIWDGWMALRPEAALGADYVVRTTTVSSEAFEPTTSQGRWSWSASGRLAVVAFPAPRWQVFVAGGADYVLNRFTYTVADERSAPVIAPRRLRPNFSCGVGFELP